MANITETQSPELNMYDASTGSENDRIQLTASGDGTADVVADKNTIESGAGNDVASLKVVNTDAGYNAVASGNYLYSVTGGGLDGNNRFTIQATNSKGDAVISGNTVIASIGDDRILLDARSGSENGLPLGADALISKSFIEAGTGKNRIDLKVKANGKGDDADITSNEILSDSGNDIIKIQLKGGGEDAADLLGADTTFDNNTIFAGDGDNQIHVKSSAASKGDDSIIYKNEMYTGNGDDIFKIKQQAGGVSGSADIGTQRAFLEENTISTGSGNDRLNIQQKATKGTYAETAVRSNIVMMGNGNDVLQVNGRGNWHSNVRNNTIEMGSGENEISLQLSPKRTGSFNGNEITTGGDDDSINLSSKAKGSFFRYNILLDTGGDNQLKIDMKAKNIGISDIKENEVSFGNGDDEISIQLRGGGQTVYAGILENTISTGDGENSVLLKSKQPNQSPYSLIRENQILLGNDGNNLSLVATGAERALSQGNTIIGGNGEDYITLEVDSKMNTGIGETVVITGGDNDHVKLISKSKMGYGVHTDSIFNLGAGDDRLVLEFREKLIVENASERFLADNTIDGSTGFDTVELKSKNQLIDFNNIDPTTNLYNIEHLALGRKSTLDLTETSDVMDMTDGDNNLLITGHSSNDLILAAATWNEVGEVDYAGYSTIQFTSGAMTLFVEQGIDVIT